MQTRENEVTVVVQQILDQVRRAVVGKDVTLMWVLAAILARGHILLEDIPGVGKTTMALAFSKALDLKYSRVQFTPDVLPSDILGFSDGGNIALLFALKNPKMVRKLILNGANLFPKGVKKTVQLPIELGYRLAKPFTHLSEKAKKNAEMLSLMVNDPYIEPNELRYICAPTLVIAGTHDMIKESHTRLIAEKIPGARLKFIEGDHFIAHKNPDEFNKAAEAFLNGHI